MKRKQKTLIHYDSEMVRIKPSELGDKAWEKGTVSKGLDERSYEVLPNSGMLAHDKTSEQD